MYYKVRIKKLPNKAFGGTKTGQQTADGALAIQPTALGGADIDQYIGEKESEVKTTLQPVPREEANVEVEKGEIVAGDLNGDGMLETYVAGGKRHSQGGTPLNLPDDTFIFSDTKSMRIKDPDMLQKFGKTSGSYTPADLAKQYDINKYRKILQDPNSDIIDKKTAELMIRNYTVKLGALAVAQESKKGFPQGIPLIAQPFLEANGIQEDQILPTYQPQFASQEEQESPTEDAMEPQEEVGYDESMPTQMPSGQDIAMTQEMMQQAPMAAYGMEMGGFNMPYTPQYAYGGNVLPKAQGGKEITSDEQKIIDTEWSGNKDAYLKYKNLEETLKSDPDFKNELYAQYKKTIQDSKNYTGSKANWYDALKDRSADEVLDQLLAQEKRNRKLQAAGLNASSTDQSPYDSKKPINKQTRDFIAAHPGLGLKESDFERGHIGQAAYIAYDDLMKNKGYKKAKLKQEGVSDELAGREQISGIDQKSTNTTLGQFIYGIPEKKKKVVEQVEEEDQEAEDRPDLYNMEDPELPTRTRPEWMTPDVVNMYGTLKDKYSINKYYPWAAPVDLLEATPVYLDPTRELAANSEQANIAMQNLAQFTGPQVASARAAMVQGQGAKQAADILSRYNNANIGVANQFEQYNKNIQNQERLQNQGIAKTLYDQTTLTNQAYDNAMRQADQAARLAFQTGWTNASNLALVNATADQYDIDPKTGDVIFQGGKDIQPELARSFRKTVMDYISLGFSKAEAIQAAKNELSQGSPYGGLDALVNSKKGGMIVTGPLLYPFVL